MPKIYKLFVALIIAFLPLTSFCNKQPLVSLQCEYLSNPLGIDVEHPRLMWHMNSKKPQQQQAYRIIVANSIEKLNTDSALVWDSGKIKADDQIVYYEGAPLMAHKRYYWKVEIWTAGKKIVSKPTWFETAKIASSDWKASWITDTHDKEFEPSPRFRKVFNAQKPIAEARCYISGLGYYQLYLNGKTIGESSLNPGFTDYSKRVLYNTYDVTEALQKGTNCIGVQLGNGWFNEQTPTVWYFHLAPWRARPQLLCEVLITYTDGEQEIIKSDTSWQTNTGPVRFDNIHVGTTYDARLEQPGWNTVNFKESWKASTLANAPAHLIESQKMPLIAETDRYSPVSVTKINDTCYVYDMGMNTAGITEVRIKGQKGTRVMVRHAEMLDSVGNIDQRNINMHLRPRNEREIIQSDVYILKGAGEEVFKPAFTYHGFQYVEITSDHPIAQEDIHLQGIKMHSDVDEIGSFTSSSELLNKILAICKNSYLSNLYSLPTDCPTREKNGWMADGFMVQEAGMLNYNSNTIYAKWVKDMVDAQQENGNMPGIVPTSHEWNSDWAGPIWDAAIFIVPMNLYDYYEDKESIKNIYATAERYLNYLETEENEKGLLSSGLGDWLFYKAETSTEFMVTAYYYWDNILMARMAHILDKNADEAKYLKKAEELKQIINKEFFDEGKIAYANETQLSYALPLYMSLVPEKYENQLAQNLNNKIKDNDYYLDYGFIGSLIVPEVLSNYGYAETVFKMVTQEKMPSWGNWVLEEGATSLFETWDINRNIGDASRNHPSMGAIAAWMYKTLAGINKAEKTPAFKDIRIQPAFIPQLDFVKASYESQYGRITSEWKRTGKKIKFKVSIPAGCSSTIVLPQETKIVNGGSYTFRLNAVDLEY